MNEQTFADHMRVGTAIDHRNAVCLSGLTPKVRLYRVEPLPSLSFIVCARFVFLAALLLGTLLS